MDTQNLQAFLLVAETGSFSLAAEQLHLTQPAVSKRVALLEEQLDEVTGLSRKAGELSETLITDAYISRFNEELRNLGAARIQVELVKTRVELGMMVGSFSMAASSSLLSMSSMKLPV